jgi:uncharacterized protein (DUF1015 family)
VADLRPFRGLHFDPARVNLSAVVCPPFDVISPAEQQAYHARDPHNIIRVELGLGPADPLAPGNRYTAAAEALARWQAERILVRDAVPSLYLYEHQFVLQGRRLARRGVLVAGRLHDWTEGAVLPHEGTRAGPKQDRLALLRATRANVSPLWLLYEDTDGQIAAALAPGHQAEPLAIAETGGERHVLRRLADSAALRALHDAFRHRPLYIADGHHRYETAQAYRDERRGQTAGPSARSDADAGYEFALMLLVARDDPGLVVQPTHRLVRHLGRPLADVRAALARWLTLSALALPAGGDAQVGSALEQALAAAGAEGPAFGLYEGGGAWLLRPRPAASWQALLPPGHSDAWRRLDVAVLDAIAIREVCGIRAEGESAHADAARGQASDRLAYASDAAEAVAAVRSGAAQQAYLLNPPRVEQVCAVAAARDRMPPKSTFFYPKIPTGLVFNPLE